MSQYSECFNKFVTEKVAPSLNSDSELEAAFADLYSAGQTIYGQLTTEQFRGILEFTAKAEAEDLSDLQTAQVSFEVFKASVRMFLRTR